MSPRRRPERRVPLAALGLLCAASLIPLPARAQTTVSLWHAYGEAEAEGLKRAIEQFEAAHPDIDVEVVHNAYGAYLPKLEAAIPTGRGPDVFIDAHERLANFVSRELVTPMEPGLDSRIDFEASHLEALSADGRIYGLPLSLKCAALYLNTHFVPEPPTSLEALSAIRPRLPDDGYALVFEAEAPYYDAGFLHAFGGSLIDEQGAYTFEGEAAEQTLTLIRKLTRDGLVPEEPNADLVRQLFASGKAGAAISGPWLAPDLPEDLDWTVIPLPPLEAAGGRVMVPYLTVEAAFLSHGTQNAAAAQRLVAFLAGPDGSVLRARHGRQVVASKTAWERPELRDDAFLRTFADAARSAIPMSSHPNMRSVFEPVQRGIRKVMRGDTPIDLALAEAHRRFEDVTRPLPKERNPTPAFLLIGLALLAMVGYMVRQGRSTTFRRELRASLPAYRYVTHAALAVGLLVITPLLVGVATSFFAGRGSDMHYVGLANYVDILSARGGELLGHGSFWLVLMVTVLWTVLNLALHLGFGMALALLLHRPTLRFKGIYRVLLILPWAVPNYVTALSWKGMFHRQFGAVNAILDALGAEPISWFARWSTAFAANLATNVWLGFPFMMVVTLGALTAIPKDLYEAAEVDGASRPQRFRLITLPMLQPMLAPAVALGAIWTFNMFNVVFLVSGGEPDGGTEILVSEAYRWAFTRSSQYGYAAAYAVLIFGILLLTTRRFGQRQDGMGATT